MQESKNIYNASVEIIYNSDEARVIRVYPDSYKMKYKPGQYGSLGLKSHNNPNKILKRAFCISSSMINIANKKLINHADIDYYEFYFNKVPNTNREQLTPKLFGLNNGDRLYCGGKIVGYYTTGNLMNNMNVLLLGTTTGESPNNSIVAELLLHKKASNICNVTIGPPEWSSLYIEHHQELMDLHGNYLFHNIHIEKILDLENMILSALNDEAHSIENFGFNLHPKSSHMFLAGDPRMIGAPKKEGRWEYEHSTGGIIPILTSHGFEISTRFKPGNVEYECYW